MSKTRQWRLDPDEVEHALTSARSGNRKHARQSRSLDVSETRIALTHRPTGVVVEGSIPPGHYSKAQLRAHKAELEATLLVELERRVARHLRIPGF